MPHEIKYAITTFYCFFALNDEQLQNLQKKLNPLGKKLNLKGSFILSREGINVTVSSSNPEAINRFEVLVKKLFPKQKFFFKRSHCDVLPFRRWLVQIRETVVNMGAGEVLSKVAEGTHLSPKEWDKYLSKENVVVLDTRNDYEYEIGRFKTARELKITEFQEFRQALKQADYDKEKTYLIYCTGGIRCEKAIVEMHRQGFKKVKQLQGGIINYLQHGPKQNWQGDCFIFDHRVVLDKNLNRSKDHGLCPHTGLIGAVPIACKRCGTKTLVHESALKAEHFYTCSKNCAHHYQLNPGKTGRQQKRNYEETA